MPGDHEKFSILLKRECHRLGKKIKALGPAKPSYVDVQLESVMADACPDAKYVFMKGPASMSSPEHNAVMSCYVKVGRSESEFRKLCGKEEKALDELTYRVLGTRYFYLVPGSWYSYLVKDQDTILATLKALHFSRYDVDSKGITTPKLKESSKWK